MDAVFAAHSGTRYLVLVAGVSNAFDYPGFVPAFADALDAHRAFGNLSRIILPRTLRHRAFAGLVKANLALSRPRLA